MTTPRWPEMVTGRAKQPAFWADTFDLDLLKLVPDLPALLGEVVDLELRTHGDVDGNGRLTHPSVWNGYAGMLAYFGFTEPALPATFYTSEPVVCCTVLEAFRDAWVHDYFLMVERETVWARPPLAGTFQALLSHRRGWGEPLPAWRDAQLLEQLRASVRPAYGRLSLLAMGR